MSSMNNETGLGKARTIPEPAERILGFRVSLCDNESVLDELWLPCTASGSYTLRNGTDKVIMTIRAVNGAWCACPGSYSFFKEVPLQFAQQFPLEETQYLVMAGESEDYYIYFQAINGHNGAFRNVNLISEFTARVGSAADTNISLYHSFLEPEHFQLARKKGEWLLFCEENAKVYVNRKRMTSCRLHLGDSIFAGGVQMLIGTSFISIRGSENDIVVEADLLRPMRVHSTQSVLYKADDYVETTPKLYERPPRKKFSIETPKIIVEGPPFSMYHQQLPLALRLGGSMVMSGKAALTGNYTMLLSSVLFPLLSSKYTEQQRKEYEARRVTKYTEYLERKDAEIKAACSKEKQQLEQMHPTFETVLSKTIKDNRFWERRPDDGDFLHIRLGNGTIETRVQIDVPDKSFRLDDDPLETSLYQLAERKRLHQNAPIALSLMDDNVCGLEGKHDQCINLMKSMIIQLSVLHSYDEVKMIFFLQEDDLKDIDFIRYLPHCWDDEKKMRFIVINEADTFLISNYLRGQLGNIVEERRDIQQILRGRPYYVVFVRNRGLFESAEVFKDILSTQQNIGISIVTIEASPLKECRKLIKVDSTEESVLISLVNENESDTSFFMEDCESDAMRSMARKCVKRIANTTLVKSKEQFEIPKIVTFLELFQSGRVEHLNVTKRWRENNPVVSLSAPIGIGADGKLFFLDLHEKKQGPHGLVAGMTGSGKSEFLITYILSMAVNYHPDEVAFILIDYKGGGLAGAFENKQTGVRLPHLVGVITNLGGGEIQRSLMSIESELRRRQRILNAARDELGEGTLDIYSYQKLYRARQVSDPLPHLLIISDEFAELKQQQPEFMEKLISTARIGRSLGVHLILATQKPSGVVNDQIRSNTKFRVCLRVQDRADSIDMLKRPEAAELTDTGRFYMQVGYNEFFALGQSAWCGAEYQPQDSVLVKRDDTIEFIEASGAAILKTAPKAKRPQGKATQIVAVVQYLSDLARQMNYKSKELWQPPLPKHLSLESLWRNNQPCSRALFEIPLGLVDDPENQAQHLLSLDLEFSQNLLVVGETGSGKSTLFQTVLYSLLQKHSPESLNYYIMDFSNKLLAPFRALPHCGAYLSMDDESSIQRLLDMLTDEILQRKRKFQAANISGFHDYITLEKLPLLLVVINNYAGFAATKVGDALTYKMNGYLRECTTYGVVYLISAGFYNDVPARLRQELHTRIALKAKDRYEYADILGGKVGAVPADIPGHGMCMYNGKPLETVFAALIPSESSLARAQYLRHGIEKIAEQYAYSARARQLTMIDPIETYEDFAKKFKPGRIPLGYALADTRMVALPLRQTYCITIYFGNSRALMPIMSNFQHSANRDNMETIIVRKRENSCFLQAEPEAGSKSFVDCTREGTEQVLGRLIYEIQRRKPYRNDYCRSNGISESDTDALYLASDYIRKNTRGLLVIFESLLDFCEAIPAEKVPFYHEIFAKGKGMNFYFLGCTYPNEAERIQSSSVFKEFNKEKLILLFGGQYDKQRLISLPMEYRSLSAQSEKYNRYLFHYQGKLHAMFMPCGELTAVIDEDDAPIL